jgi:uncharacterized protein YndB with AHSA1/START domain
MDNENPCMTQETLAVPLTLSRLIPVPRAKLWRCWTEPELLKQWFCPKPWGVSHAEIDVRAGGASHIVMQGPDGQEMPTRGVYLEVVPGEKLVFTDAFVRAWKPSGKAFIVATVTFADEAGGTRYQAMVEHWSEADREQHEAMGFHAGWGAAADQLAALAATL